MKKSFLTVHALLLLSAALGISRAVADESRAAAGDYEGKKWALVDAKGVIEAANAISLTNYPDCDEATVEKKMVRVYRPDGTGECQDESFVKVLTEKGKRGNRSLSLWYMLPYSVAEAVKVEVIKP